MCGRATFATLVSSTSIKVASITVMAMIHGLMGTLVALSLFRIVLISVCSLRGI